MHVSLHPNRHIAWLMLLTAAVAAGCAGAPTKPAGGERICITASEALAARIGEKQDPSAVLYTAADGTHTLCFNLSDANRITLDLGSGIAAAPIQPGVPPPPAAQDGKGGGWIWDTPPAVPPPPSSPTSAAAVPDTTPVKPMPGVTLPTSFADSEMLPILGSPIRGGAQAPVTIVVFEDMQCPFCARALNTEEQILTTFGDQVRVVSKHYPLSFHKQARSAAQAAIAAGNQGKFWEYRHLLMHNQKALHDEALVAYAQRLGLDVARFNADRQSKATDTIIDRDMALARKVSVQGTPHFFINGRRLSGAQPFDVFRKAIQDELDTGGGGAYAQRVKGNYAPPKPKPKTAVLPDDTVFRVPVEKGDAILGKTPKAVVTIVEFSEFQCPFCGRVQDALRKVRETYGDRVRIVFKHNPLPFHKQAEPAARAAIAAGNQGKFWEYHDLLFDNPHALSTDDLEGYAQQLKLNMNRFRRDMQAARTATLIKRDQELAQKLGARGTPIFFVNGRKFVGAKPFGDFKQAIDDAIANAEPKLKRGLRGERLYRALTQDGLESVAAAAPTPSADGDTKVERVNIAIGKAPTRGPKRAPVTIVVFSDFQCPYCSRAQKTLDTLAKSYKGKIRFVFKHNPLPFHEQAKPAALAALAAHSQGKFWEYHDLLFNNQRALSTGDLERYAQQIGLDLQRFRKDMHSDRIRAVLNNDRQQASKVGARGTPTFFINGRILVGAQPAEKFKEMIDQELAQQRKGRKR